MVSVLRPRDFALQWKLLSFGDRRRITGVAFRGAKATSVADAALVVGHVGWRFHRWWVPLLPLAAAILFLMSLVVWGERPFISLVGRAWGQEVGVLLGLAIYTFGMTRYARARRVNRALIKEGKSQRRSSM